MEVVERKKEDILIQGKVYEDQNQDQDQDQELNLIKKEKQNLKKDKFINLIIY